MKKLSWRLLAVLLVAGSAAVSGTKAQDVGGGVTITVSNPFVAGEATLPTGSYTVTQDPCLYPYAGHSPVSLTRRVH